MQVNLLSPKMLLPFHALSDEADNTYSQFSRKLFNRFENCFQIVIEVLELYKSVLHEWRLPQNGVSIFQGENVSPGKTEKS